MSDTIDKRGLLLYLAGCIDSLQLVTDRIGGNTPDDQTRPAATSLTPAPAEERAPGGRRLTARHVLDVLRQAGGALSATEIRDALAAMGQNRTMAKVHMAVARLIEAGWVVRQNYAYSLRTDIPNPFPFDEASGDE